MFNFLNKFMNKNKGNRFQFYNLGFHGDRYLITLAKFLLKRSNYFIETGTNVGSTLAFVARTFPDIHCFSCEPEKNAFKEASKNTSKYLNVEIYNKISQEFLDVIYKEKKWLFDKEVLFWLDAHGYGFRWPLKEEISFITRNFQRAYILIDDFKVPHLDCFSWDEYKGQQCSFDFIKNSIKKGLDFSLYYPAYTEKTSRHHPLIGWGLIVFGHDTELNIPHDLINKIIKVH